MAVALAFWAGTVIGSAGCSRTAKTPEEAYRRLTEAVAARDGERLFEALDLDTRWSWMSIQRAHREGYDITLSNFPEGHERERQLRRFEAGAHSESAAALFAKELPAARWGELAAALGSGPASAIVITGDTAEAKSGAGKKLSFRKSQDKNWGWGYAGLAGEAEQLKRRALYDLELIRAGAADYERAAARGAR